MSALLKKVLLAMGGGIIALLVIFLFAFSAAPSAAFADNGKICVHGQCLNDLGQLPVHGTLDKSLIYFQSSQQICSGSIGGTNVPQHCYDQANFKEGLGNVAGDSRYSKGYCVNDTSGMNGKHCATEYEPQVVNTTGLLCIKGRCYDPSIIPTVDFTINDQKGVVWIPAESDIHLRWNLANAESVILSCTGDCPSNLHDINDRIRTTEVVTGAVDSSLITSDSSWTLAVYRGSIIVYTTIVVVPLYNEYSDWAQVYPLKGHKYLDGQGRWNYAVDYVYDASPNPREQLIHLYNGGSTQCTEPPNRSCTSSGCLISGCFTPLVDLHPEVPSFNFMKLADYNDARNKVASGQTIILTMRHAAYSISSVQEFEHYAGLPPCADADYDLLRSSIASAPISSLTPAYRCGSEQKMCIDYEPVCNEGKDTNLQTEGGTPNKPYLWDNWCTIVGVKSRVVQCNGKDEGDIQKERDRRL